MDKIEVLRFRSNDQTCPVCGWKCNGSDGGLRVSMERTTGIYCLECYGKWIDANIPKMIEDKPNG